MVSSVLPSLVRAMSSPTLVAAAVMMSRFPAYGGRKSPAPSTSTKMATRAIPPVISVGGSNCGSWSSRYPGTYSWISFSRLRMAVVMRSWSAPEGIAQKMVSRMIIGGSAGLRMMIALPRLAPPTFSMASLVVSVNSSMFARVPGPADSEETEATISAYSTGTTEETAWTIGMVAWPPQVTMLWFGASTWSCRLAGGMTIGPTAAGVRSMAVMPAAS